MRPLIMPFIFLLSAAATPDTAAESKEVPPAHYDQPPLSVVVGPDGDISLSYGCEQCAFDGTLLISGAADTAIAGFDSTADTATIDGNGMSAFASRTGPHRGWIRLQFFTTIAFKSSFANENT